MQMTRICKITSKIANRVMWEQEKKLSEQSNTKKNKNMLYISVQNIN